jgi:hypothetical protein
LWKAASSEPAKGAEALASTLASTFDVELERARADVNALLDELDGEGLVSYRRTP